MTDWRTRMREAIDSDGEERLSADDARAMRRVVVGAARRGGGGTDVNSWKRPVAFAATVILMVGAGITAGRHLNLDLSNREESTLGSVAGVGPVEPARPNRQLQFATPGGTRIIWVFNADLDLKATMP